MVKRLPAMWETLVRSLGQEDPLEIASFNFMAAVTICSDFGAQKDKV